MTADKLTVAQKMYDSREHTLEADDTRERAITANKQLARERDGLVATVEQARAEVAHNRQVRAGLVESMTPDEVAEADNARDALLNARQHERLRQAERELHHGLDRGGPGLGL